jgi:methylglutaconyl-CoA hydratase
MEFRTIEFSIIDQVAHLWLNRPDKRNALNAAMLGELRSCFESLIHQEEARILVIRGRGPVFCAGADLSLMRETSDKSERDLQSEAALFYDCFDSLYHLPLPVICHAHGAVHGGGNGLLAASDFVLTSEDTRFSFSEVRLGLVPATVAPFVLHRMGILRAKQAMLSGSEMRGSEARAFGLVDRLVEPEEAEAAIRQLVDQLKKNAPGALKMTKRLLNDIEHKEIGREMRILTTQLIARARRLEEAWEGIEAFFSKRLPNWRNTP